MPSIYDEIEDEKLKAKNSIYDNESLDLSDSIYGPDSIESYESIYDQEGSGAIDGFSTPEYSTANEIRSGILDGFLDFSEEDIPFVGGIAEGARYFNLASLASKVNNGEELTDQETFELKLGMKELEDAENQDWTYTAGETIRGSLTFALELAASAVLVASVVGAPAGAGTAGTAVASKGARATGIKAFKLAVKKYMSKSLKGGLARGTRLALKRKLRNTVGKTAAKIISKAGYLGAVALADNIATSDGIFAGMERRKMEAVFRGQDPNEVNTFSNALLDNVIENLSERSGRLIGSVGASIIPKAIKEKTVVMAIAKFLNASPGKNAGYLANVFNKAGVNGVLEEMGEERLGGFLRGLFGVDGEASLARAIDMAIPTVEQMKIESVAFSIPGIVRSTMYASVSPSVALYKKRQRDKELNNVITKSGVQFPEKETVSQARNNDKAFYDQYRAFAQGNLNLTPKQISQLRSEKIVVDARTELRDGPLAVEKAKYDKNVQHLVNLDQEDTKEKIIAHVFDENIGELAEFKDFREAIIKDELPDTYDELYRTFNRDVKPSETEQEKNTNILGMIETYDEFVSLVNQGANNPLISARTDTKIKDGYLDQSQKTDIRDINSFGEMTFAQVVGEDQNALNNNLAQLAETEDVNMRVAQSDQMHPGYRLNSTARKHLYSQRLIETMRQKQADIATEEAKRAEAEANAELIQKVPVDTAPVDTTPKKDTPGQAKLDKVGEENKKAESKPIKRPVLRDKSVKDLKTSKEVKAIEKLALNLSNAVEDFKEDTSALKRNEILASVAEKAVNVPEDTKAKMLKKMQGKGTPLGFSKENKEAKTDPQKKLDVPSETIDVKYKRADIEAEKVAKIVEAIIDAKDVADIPSRLNSALKAAKADLGKRFGPRNAVVLGILDKLSKQVYKYLRHPLSFSQNDKELLEGIYNDSSDINGLFKDAISLHSFLNGMNLRIETLDNLKDFMFEIEKYHFDKNTLNPEIKFMDQHLNNVDIRDVINLAKTGTFAQFKAFLVKYADDPEAVSEMKDRDLKKYKHVFSSQYSVDVMGIQKDNFYSEYYDIQTYSPGEKSYTDPYKKDKRYVIFDLETTGLNPKTSDVFQIAYTVVENGVEQEPVEIVLNVDNLDLFLKHNPVMNNKEMISKYLEQSKKSPNRDKVVQQLREVFLETDPENTILVGHNINDFDVKFLQKDIEEVTKVEKYDTYEHAKEQVPQDNRKLITLGSAFGADVTITHDAVHDVNITKKVFEGLHNIKPESEIKRGQSKPLGGTLIRKNKNDLLGDLQKAFGTNTQRAGHDMKTAREVFEAVNIWEKGRLAVIADGGYNKDDVPLPGIKKNVQFSTWWNENQNQIIKLIDKHSSDHEMVFNNKDGFKESSFRRFNGVIKNDSDAKNFSLLDENMLQVAATQESLFKARFKLFLHSVLTGDEKLHYLMSPVRHYGLLRKDDMIWEKDPISSQMISDYKINDATIKKHLKRDSAKWIYNVLFPGAEWTPARSKIVATYDLIFGDLLERGLAEDKAILGPQIYQDKPKDVIARIQHIFSPRIRGYEKAKNIDSKYTVKHLKLTPEQITALGGIENLFDSVDGSRFVLGKFMGRLSDAMGLAAANPVSLKNIHTEMIGKNQYIDKAMDQNIDSLIEEVELDGNEAKAKVLRDIRALMVDEKNPNKMIMVSIEIDGKSSANKLNPEKSDSQELNLSELGFQEESYLGGEEESVVMYTQLISNFMADDKFGEYINEAYEATAKEINAVTLDKDGNKIYDKMIRNEALISMIKNDRSLKGNVVAQDHVKDEVLAYLAQMLQPKIKSTKTRTVGSFGLELKSFRVEDGVAHAGEVMVWAPGLRENSEERTRKFAEAEIKENKNGMYDDIEIDEVVLISKGKTSAYDMVYIPGALILSNRLPADDWHQHTPVRLKRNLATESNAIYINAKDDALSGGDKDGDQRFNITGEIAKLAWDAIRKNPKRFSQETDAKKFDSIWKEVFPGTEKRPSESLTITENNPENAQNAWRAMLMGQEGSMGILSSIQAKFKILHAQGKFSGMNQDRFEEIVDLIGTFMQISVDNAKNLTAVDYKLHGGYINYILYRYINNNDSLVDIYKDLYQENSLFEKYENDYFRFGKFKALSNVDTSTPEGTQFKEDLKKARDFFREAELPYAAMTHKIRSFDHNLMPTAKDIKKFDSKSIGLEKATNSMFTKLHELLPDLAEWDINSDGREEGYFGNEGKYNNDLKSQKYIFMMNHYFMPADRSKVNEAIATFRAEYPEAIKTPNYVPSAESKAQFLTYWNTLSPIEKQAVWAYIVKEHRRLGYKKFNGKAFGLIPENFQKRMFIKMGEIMPEVLKNPLTWVDVRKENAMFDSFFKQMEANFGSSPVVVVQGDKSYYDTDADVIVLREGYTQEELVHELLHSSFVYQFEHDPAFKSLVDQIAIGAHDYAQAQTDVEVEELDYQQKMEMVVDMLVSDAVHRNKDNADLSEAEIAENEEKYQNFATIFGEKLIDFVKKLYAKFQSYMPFFHQNKNDNKRTFDVLLIELSKYIKRGTESQVHSALDRRFDENRAERLTFTGNKAEYTEKQVKDSAEMANLMSTMFPGDKVNDQVFADELHKVFASMDKIDPKSTWVADRIVKEVKEEFGNDEFAQALKDIAISVANGEENTDPRIEKFAVKYRNFIDKFYDNLGFSNNIEGINDRAMIKIQTYRSQGLKAINKRLSFIIGEPVDFDEKEARKHFKQHFPAEDFDATLKGDVSIHTMVKNIMLYSTRIAEMRKMTQAMMSTGFASTEPLPGYEKVETSLFHDWEYFVKQMPRSFRVSPDYFARKQDIYVEAKYAKILNSIYKNSQLKGNGFFDFLTTITNVTKLILLQFGLFHDKAFVISFVLGGAGNSFKNFTTFWGRMNEGLAIFDVAFEDEFFPSNVTDQQLVKRGMMLRALFEAGLTSFSTEEYDESVYFDNFFAQQMNNYKWSRFVKGMSKKRSKWLFSNLGAGLKYLAAVDEIEHQMDSLKPGEDPQQMLEAVASVINADFGGINQSRERKMFGIQGLERTQTRQQIFKLLALAPDWTESNWLLFDKAIKSDNPVEQRLARAFVSRIMYRYLIFASLAALALGLVPDSNGDDDEEYMERLIRRFNEAWNSGNLAWLQTDVSPLMEAIGMTPGSKAYFNASGHFMDYLKLIPDPTGDSLLEKPANFAKHKTSVPAKMFLELITGQNSFGSSFTTLEELGKTGRLTNFGKSKSAISSRNRLSQMFSYLASQASNALPIAGKAAFGTVNPNTDWDRRLKLFSDLTALNLRVKKKRGTEIDTQGVFGKAFDAMRDMNPEFGKPATVVKVGKMDIDPELLNKNASFALDFDKEHQLPRWTAERLTAESIKGSSDIARPKKFKVDVGDVTHRDYSPYTNINRGHIAAAGNYNTKKTKNATFYMSNVAPQDEKFNQKKWAELEGWTRNLTENGPVEVYTGPILDDFYLQKMSGDGTVSVPRRFYKVVVQDGKAIGFIMENKALEGKLRDYAVSVDEVERLTNIDFLTNADEASVGYSKWNWVNRRFMRK